MNNTFLLRASVLIFFLTLFRDDRLSVHLHLIVASNGICLRPFLVFDEIVVTASKNYEILGELILFTIKACNNVKMLGFDCHNTSTKRCIIGRWSSTGNWSHFERTRVSAIKPVLKSAEEAI